MLDVLTEIYHVKQEQGDKQTGFVELAARFVIMELCGNCRF